MHGKDTFSEFREFINTMESRVQELKNRVCPLLSSSFK